ncbi:hypothetical protein [Catenibacterium mitsuokai]|uniref:hypothetical protein n=1 Tax=Catenibacterium mitsuokai TaxID=100886 RepID=UPI000196C8A1|nr:hypothetical protein [Catenibacterium mitsuokai]EEF92875.1 hypothetical protein CATMIT_02437 [Catenibacterium mitsuokai DSM 15897]UWO52053.1 hypothetical protein NQ499_07130 [Catenibacterium mitsuokai]
MTGPCFRFLWQEPEYSTVDENLVFHLKDDAPEIAKKTIKSIKDTIQKKWKKNMLNFSEKLKKKLIMETMIESYLQSKRKKMINYA